MKNPFKGLGKPYGRSHDEELLKYNTGRQMAASELPNSGGALIDVITLQNSLFTLIPRSSVWSQLQLISLANFIESIVLYEKLYVDKESFERSVVDRFSNQYRLSDILGDQILSILVPLSSSESERQFADMYARSVASSVDFNSLYSQVNKFYPNMDEEESMSAGYLGEEFVEESATGISLGDELRDKLSVLRGCAFRAWFYLGLSMQKNVMYVPNDFRAIFIPSGLPVGSSAAKIFRKLEEIFNKKVEETAEWFNEQCPEIHLRLPLIFNFIISKAADRSDIIPLALEIRDTQSAHKFREICKELDKARKKGNVKSMIEITKEIDRELQNIGKMQNSRSSFDITLGFPPSLSTTLETDIIKSLWHSRQFVFLRNIFDGSRDPRSIEQLNRLIPRWGS